MNIETANILLSYRKKHNLSQEELAEKIGVAVRQYPNGSVPRLHPTPTI